MNPYRIHENPIEVIERLHKEYVFDELDWILFWRNVAIQLASLGSEPRFVLDQIKNFRAGKEAKLISEFVKKLTSFPKTKAKTKKETAKPQPKLPYMLTDDDIKKLVHRNDVDSLAVAYRELCNFIRSRR